MEVGSADFCPLGFARVQITLAMVDPIQWDFLSAVCPLIKYPYFRYGNNKLPTPVFNIAVLLNDFIF